MNPLLVRDLSHGLLGYSMNGKANSSPTPAQPIAAQADPTPERWHRIKELFVEAQQRRITERSAFLRQQCGEDESLQSDVESLLVAAESELQEPVTAGTAAGPSRADPMIDRRIGPYKIIRQIGRGGMATVYVAARADEQFDKQVAIKILLPELESDELQIRFRNERQTLAKLDHPNIVKLLDGGTNEDGLPYLVMDYVEGTPVDQYCDRHKLSTEQRLNLFCQVCAAVHCAHQNLVVHRDLKPSNILVTADGVPKLLDFGISKVLDSASALSITKTVTRRMTPAYASPEQVRGKHVTPATDIYSLGVVLYELLTGRRPYRLKQNTPAEMEHAICDQEPDKPSTAVTREEEGHRVDGVAVFMTPEVISALRKDQPETLRRRLMGDLDTIVLTALQKEPQRRYLSVEHLSGDIRRHLQRLPVTARRSTLVYRSSKFIRRHTTEVIASALIAVVTLGATSLVIRERRQAMEKARAELAIQRSHGRRSIAVLGFKNLSGRPDTTWLSTALAEMLTTELSAGGKLRTIPGESVAETKISLGLPEEDTFSPLTLGKIYKNLGSDYVVLGSYLDLADSGRRIRVDLRVQDAALQETVASFTEAGTEANLPDLVTQAGATLRARLGMAGVSPAEAASIQASLPSNPESTRLYAEGLAKLRVFDALGARDLLNQAIAANPSDALARSALATAWSALGYIGKAKEESRMALGLSRELGREDSLLVEARYEQAAGNSDKAIDLYKALFNFFPDSLEYGLDLAAAQTESSRGKDALATLQALRTSPYPSASDPRIDLQEAYAAASIAEYKQQALAAEHAAAKADANGARLVAAEALLTKGRALLELGEPEKGGVPLQRAMDLFGATGNEFGRARTLHAFGLLAAQSSRYDDAKQAYESALAVHKRLGNRLNEARVWNDIGNLRDSQGDLTGKAQAVDYSLVIYREIGNTEGIATALGNLGTVEAERGNDANAKRHFEEALRLHRQLDNPNGVAYDLGNLAAVLAGEGELRAALNALEESVKLSRRTGQKRALAFALFNLASVQVSLGDLDSAERIYSESRQVFADAQNQLGETGAMEGLADVRLKRGDLDGARKLNEESIAKREAVGTHVWVAPNQMAIAEISIEEGHGAEAETVLRRLLDDFRSRDDAGSAAEATILLANSLLAQGKVATAQTAAVEALQMGAKSGDREMGIYAAIADARVRAASGQVGEAIKSLHAALEEANHLRIVATQFEVLLALGSTEKKLANSAPGRNRLLSLERDAKAKGFFLMARKAAAARKQL